MLQSGGEITEPSELHALFSNATTTARARCDCDAKAYRYGLKRILLVIGPYSKRLLQSGLEKVTLELDKP